jgi:hypothetical protein
MRNLWPTHRFGPQPQALHFSHETAGLILHDQVIPWNAEAVLVEACVRLPVAGGHRKSDFQLRLPDKEPVGPESLRREDGQAFHRLLFRVPSPGQTTIRTSSIAIIPWGK